MQNKKIFVATTLVLALLVLIFLLNPFAPNKRSSLVSNVSDGPVTGFLSPLTKIFKPSPQTPLNKIASNMANPSTLGDYFISPNLVLLKDDSESVQFVVRNNTNSDISLNYRIEKDGQVSNDLGLDMYQVDFAKVTYYLYRTAGDLSPVGYYSDPLVPYRAGQTVSSSSDVVWWLTARSTENTPAGNYQIILTATINSEIITKTLPIEILNPKLPRRSSFRFVLGVDPTFDDLGEDGFTPLDYHHATTPTEKTAIVDAYFDYLNNNRMNAVEPYLDPNCLSCRNADPDALPLAVTALDLDAGTISVDFSNLDRALTNYVTNGRMNFFKLYNSSWGFIRFKIPLIYGDALITQNNSQYQQIHTLYWQAVSEHLRERGWLDYTFIYSDEPFTCIPPNAPPECRDGDYIPRDNLFFQLLRGINQETELVVLLNRTSLLRLDLFNTFSPLLNIYGLIDYPQVPDNPYNILWPYVEPILDNDDQRAAYWTTSSYVHADRPTLDSLIWIFKYWQNQVNFAFHWNPLIWVYEDKDTSGNIINIRTNPWVTGVSHRWGAAGVMLFYPPCREGDGRCATFNPEIIPSIRLENYREALENYDALIMLENLIKRARELGVNTT
ncbi:MAG: hypothetical protein AAB468_00380 [Patescibacteria group bacterium]